MAELVERMLDPSVGSELALRNSKGQALHKQLPKAKTRTFAETRDTFSISDRCQGAV